MYFNAMIIKKSGMSEFPSGGGGGKDPKLTKKRGKHKKKNDKKLLKIKNIDKK